MSSVVKKKAQEADAMIKRLAAEAADGAQPPADPPANPPEDLTPSQPPLQAVEPPALVDPPPADPAPTPVDHSAELAEVKSQLAKADQRWKTLQGQISSKDQQIEQLHQLLAKMDQVAPAPAPQAPAPAPVGHSKEDVDAFGEDLIDLVTRIATQVATHTAQSLTTTIEGLEAKVGQVEQVSTKVVANSFESTMAELFPAWGELNEDAGFIAWLQDSATRLNLFSAAAKAKDATEVAGFFQLYADKFGWKPASAAADIRAQRQQQQVQPGTSVSGAAPSAQSTPEEPKVWTRSAIAATYANKRNYAADEFAKLEREISKAMQENRVDYSQ